MHKLTLIEDLPRPDPKRVAPHRYRVLGGRVLLTNDAGARVFLDASEYRQYLRGIDEGHPLWARLQPKGFAAHAFDVDAAAGAELAGGLLSWDGPSRHLLFIERGGTAMALETVQDAVDLAFSAPGPGLRLELAGSPERAWPGLWLAVEYARRKSEWSGRSLELAARIGTRDFSTGQNEYLRSNGVKRLADLVIKGGPVPLPGAERLLLRVSASARDPGGWARAARDAGASRVRLSPERLPAGAEGLRHFLGFYAGFLDRLIAESGPQEERAAAFLSARRWRLPGQDLLAELAYAPDGAVYASEEGLALAESGSPLLRLGRVGDMLYADLAKSDAVRAALAAVQRENQPLCFQCVYAPFCALPPSANLRRRGGPWGQTPASVLCSLHMGILDAIFMRLDAEKYNSCLENWSIDSD